VIDKKITTNQKEMAEILNEYFLFIATMSRVNDNIDLGISVDASTKYLWDIFSTPFTKMKSFKMKNSSGYDEISSRIIKASLPYITSPLTYICNAVLHYSVFPDRLKYAVVKPCFKIQKYRPISLLTTFSKVIEKLI
jgi:hypothetical protein